MQVTAWTIPKWESMDDGQEARCYEIAKLYSKNCEASLRSSKAADIAIPRMQSGVHSLCLRILRHA